MKPMKQMKLEIAITLTLSAFFIGLFISNTISARYQKDNKLILTKQMTLLAVYFIVFFPYDEY